MKKALYIISNLLTLLTWISVLHAEVSIEITKGVDLARPIGIVPFHWIGSGSAPEDIGDIVATDLRNSGKFNPLDRSSLLQYPNTAQEVEPAAWHKLGADVVVVGQVTSNLDGSYNVTYQLVDISNTSIIVLAQNSYKVDRKWLRYAGHAASDEVFEKLTGIKGAFRTRIAYVMQVSDNKFPYELHVSDYDGYNQFIVYRSSQPLMSPAWSPDGTKLAYVTFENGRSALVIQTLANGVVYQVASFPRHNGAPAFSPDGTKLAFVLSKTGSLNLYVMDLPSKHISQITNCHSNNTEPSWFPDNQNLAFTSDQGGNPQVYKVNVNGRVMQRITWIGSQNQNADVSSDGKFMVMVSSDNGQQHIVKQDLMTGDVQILSSTSLDETPSLAPNDTMLIYSSFHGKESVLNIISTNGHFKSRLLGANGQIKFPTWSPYL